MRKFGHRRAYCNIATIMFLRVTTQSQMSVTNEFRAIRAIYQSCLSGESMRRILALTVVLMGVLAVNAIAADKPGLQIINTVTKLEPIKPIPLTLVLDSQKVALGRKLFRDPILSRNESISCASCHDLSKGGTDRRVKSLGVNGARGDVNAPTVFNSGFNFKQFWDGRSGNLEDQIEGPTQAPNEMGETWGDILRKLQSKPEYVSMFDKTYSDGLQRENIKNAIAEFERSLYAPNCRFDQYLRGNDSVLTASEKAGYQKFKAFGCISCHQGVNVGGNMFETLGTMKDYFAARGRITKADFGRFNVTGREKDRFVFKVPSLRNVALTAPYFHDGSIQTLEEAVEVMAEYQLGQRLTQKDVSDIVGFLKTLTGEYDGKPL